MENATVTTEATPSQGQPVLTVTEVGYHAERWGGAHKINQVDAEFLKERLYAIPPGTAVEKAIREDIEHRGKVPTPPEIQRDFQILGR